MTISHRFRRSGNFNLDRAAKTFSYQAHKIFLGCAKTAMSLVSPPAASALLASRARQGASAPSEGLGRSRPLLGAGRHCAGGNLRPGGVRGILRSEDAEPRITG
jgi:hypothetical protein